MGAKLQKDENQNFIWMEMMAPLVLQRSFDITLFSIIRTEHNFLGDVIC